MSTTTAIDDDLTSPTAVTATTTTCTSITKDDTETQLGPAVFLTSDGMIYHFTGKYTCRGKGFN